MSFIKDIFNPIGDLGGGILDALEEPIEAVAEGIASIPDVIEEIEEDLEGLFKILVKFIKILIKFLEILFKLLDKGEVLIDISIYLFPIAVELYYYYQLLLIKKEQEQLKEKFPTFFNNIELFLMVGFVILTYFVYSENGLGWNNLYPEAFTAKIKTRKTLGISNENIEYEITAHRERAQVRIETQEIFNTFHAEINNNGDLTAEENINGGKLMLDISENEFNRLYYIYLAGLTQPAKDVIYPMYEKNVREKWTTDLGITDDLLTTEILTALKNYWLNMYNKTYEINKTWVKSKSTTYIYQLFKAVGDIHRQPESFKYHPEVTMTTPTGTFVVAKAYTEYMYKIRNGNIQEIDLLGRGLENAYNMTVKFNDRILHYLRGVNNFTFIKPIIHEKKILNTEEIKKLREKLKHGLNPYNI